MQEAFELTHTDVAHQVQSQFAQIKGLVSIQKASSLKLMKLFGFEVTGKKKINK